MRLILLFLLAASARAEQMWVSVEMFLLPLAQVEELLDPPPPPGDAGVLYDEILGRVETGGVTVFAEAALTAKPGQGAIRRRASRPTSRRRRLRREILD